MKIASLILVFAAGAALMALTQAPAQEPKPIASGVVPWSETPETFAWGEMRKAFTGESFATKKLFVSSFVLKAGTEVHAPHRHAQEEFMTMVEGSGTWHLDGKEIPAKKGDVIYVAPWVRHGLKNTGPTPLVYFVAQWNPKGMEAAPDPEKAK